jgi:Xaa-Pro aminopeptidase
MRRARQAKLQEQLAAHELDGLLLLGTNNVTYATGAKTPGMDSSRAGLLRPVAAVVRDEDQPHLYTPYLDGAPADVHLHDDPAALLALFDETHRVGVDEIPADVARSFVSAAGVLAAAKLCKTQDELACIREAQRINELAMQDVVASLRPGVRQSDLTAVFLRRVFELGATSNGIDPIWQVMPPAAPWNFHGDIAFPTPSTDQVLTEGDVVWVDTGIVYEGYASDFGQTWVVGAEPPRRQYDRWRHVVDAVLACCRPGVPALELCDRAIAANDGVRPWIGHFYLAHGVGTDSAEMPLIGTDLGEAFDESLVMVPGMVLVFEPVIWDEGAAGYRSEDIVAITDDGWTALSTPT